MKTIYKRIVQASLLTLSFMLSSGSYGQYCTPTYSDGCVYGDDLNDVELQGNTITLSNLNSGCNGDYTDNTTMNAPDLTPGMQYTISVGTSYSSPNYESVKVWIDYDENETFDANEVIAEFSSLSAGLNSFTFEVPVSATPGIKRMRVKLDYTQDATGIDPCVGVSWGETEDYSVDILPLAACSGQPDAGIINGAPTSGVCSDVALNLSLTGATTGGDMTRQWQKREPNGANVWEDITGENSFILNLPNGISVETDFRFYIVCDNSTLADTSNIVNFTINDPADCYCEPEGTNSSRYIDDFSTTNAIQNITNNGSGFSPNGYGEFLNDTVSQVKGQSFDFSVEMGGTNTYGFKIWIDWNQDGQFDASEVAYQSSSYGSTHTGIVTVPLNAMSGPTRMRIANSFTPNSGPSGPCLVGYGSGEFEDYTFEVIVPDAPTITQSAGAPDCVNGTDLIASGTLGADETWYWQVTDDGTDMTNDASTPWTVFENGTYYVRTYDSNYQIWSDANSIEVTNVPSEANPPTPMADQNPACLPGTNITVDPAPADVEYYWQGTSSISSSMTDNASSPYNVTQTGTYYVKAYNTTTQCWSEATGITVTVGTIVPNDPVITVPAYNYCENITTAEISAEATYYDDETTLTTVTDGLYSCNGFGGGVMFNITNDQNVNITISALDIKLSSDVMPTAKVFFKPGTYEGFEENEFAWTLLGEYATTGAPNSLQYLDIDDLTIPAGETFGIYLNYQASFSLLSSTETYSDGNLTITSGNALCTAWGGINELFVFNGTVHYLPPVSTDIVWYDAATGGSVVGTTNPLEIIGTSVLPTSAVGSYEFYAASNFDGCESTNRELVTVNINPVNVTIDVVDAACNNGNDGTFTISNVECGVAPFTFSVDGGAFGGIPNDLTAGEHTVIVKDDNGDESAEYTITVGSVAGPSDVTIDDFTNDEVTVSWTSNGSESSWNIEWGVPGFTPGTGNELGSAVAGSSPYTITGLDGFTDYYIYVSADCGSGTSPEEWNFALIKTDCDVRPAIGFCEDFEDDDNLYCWRSVDNNNDDNKWAIYINNANSGDLAAGMETDANVGNNDDYYILPQMNLTGNEMLTYFYNTGGSTTNYQIVLSTNSRNPADFTTVVFADTVSNTTYKDTMVNLSAYTGDVYLAFYIPTGAIDGDILLIDDVCIDICAPTPGVDGFVEACREDETLDLNTIITSDYTDGTWNYPSNQGLINGSDLNTSTLPAGTYEMLYIVETGCTSDTTIATVDIFGPSQAGIGGVITVCKEAPIDLYSALSGNVDMGGDWYDYNGVLLGNAQPTSPSLGASYNYTYITSNGVCPADTAIVEVVVDPNCTSDIQEEMMANLSVYPNPTSGIINIVNPTNISALKVEVLDMNGRVVLTENKALNNAIEGSVNLGKLNTGVYTLRVYNEEGQKIFKVVKQ